MRIVHSYLLTDMLCTVVLMLIASTPGRHNLWFVNLIFPVQVCYMYALFGQWEPRVRRRIVPATFVGIYVLAVIIELLFTGADVFTKFEQPVGWVMIVSGAAYTLHSENKRFETGLIDQASFWVCAGLVIGGSGQLMLSMMNGIIYQFSPSMLRTAHIYFRPLFGLIELGGYFAGIFCQARFRAPLSDTIIRTSAA